MQQLQRCLDDLDLLDELLWFGTDYGPGDPLRWSPMAVEILLADWIPRKVVADFASLAKAPAVLRGLIGFSHAERGIRPGLTEETLTAVDELEPEYQETIRTLRPQGPEALLAAVGALDPEGPWPLPGDPRAEFAALMREELGRTVGGGAALDRLDDTPLPDERFRWDGVPDEAREWVAEVLELVDRFSDELLGVELQTAARRLLAAVAAADPAPVRRGKAESVASAICRIVVKAKTPSRTPVSPSRTWRGGSASGPPLPRSAPSRSCWSSASIRPDSPTGSRPSAPPTTSRPPPGPRSSRRGTGWAEPPTVGRGLRDLGRLGPTLMYLGWIGTFPLWRRSGCES